MHSATDPPCCHPILVVGATQRHHVAPCPKCGMDVEVVIYNRGGQRGWNDCTRSPITATFIIEKVPGLSDFAPLPERPKQKWSPPPGAPKKRKPFP